MKKLLVFREGLHPDPRELDDYLYDSEVIRSDFIDVPAAKELNVQHGTLAMHTSSWDVVFKDDDKYDTWHVLCEGSDTYGFEEPPFVAAINFFDPKWRHPVHLTCTAVVHKKNYMLAIYRLSKAMSEVMEMDLKFRLESFKDGAYTYEIPESVLGSLHATTAEAEVPGDAKA